MYMNFPSQSLISYGVSARGLYQLLYFRALIPVTPKSLCTQKSCDRKNLTHVVILMLTFYETRSGKETKLAKGSFNNIPLTHYIKVYIN